jgi:hypothetical protein
MRENLLYNIYAAGKRSIERGSTDTWTTNPKRWRRSRRGSVVLADEEVVVGGGVSNETRRGPSCTSPSSGPARYIIPSDQPDFPTATKFINALREVNVAVQRAHGDFTVEGKTYPAGSYVVMTAQAFRPHVMDMFEPQVHPGRVSDSRRSTDSAVRQRRLDARVADGREVRSRPRRIYRAVRAGDGLERQADGGAA